MLPAGMFLDAGLIAAAPWAGIVFDSVLVLILLCLSAVFSGSETVLFSQTPVELAHDRASSNPFRRLAAQLMDNPRRTLMIVLVGNTTINVLLFATTVVLFARLAEQFGDWVQWLSGVFSVLLVLIFGEVLPKVLGVSLYQTLAPYAAIVVRVAGFVCVPVGRLIDVLLAEPATRLLFGGRRQRTSADGRAISTSELKTLLEMSRHGGVINPTEDTFLREVIDLGALRVRDVMTPRVEIVAYDVNAPSEGLRDLMRTSRRKKIPVFDGSLDQIVGLVYAKVLFFEPHRPLREIVSPVRFVPELITGEQLLQHFRKTRSQLAIVVDEFGGVAGLVTIEDVLEEIVGEIDKPEDAPRAAEFVALADNEYDVSGRLSVHYWAETFGLTSIPERVATVGGLVSARLGRPARVGDVVRIGNVELAVTAVARRRVERVRVRLRSDDDAAAATPAEAPATNGGPT